MPTTFNDPSSQVTPVPTPDTYRPEKLPFWMRFSFQELQSAADEQLSEWLHDVKMQDLRHMAQEHKWPVKGNRKKDIVQQILAQLLDAGQAIKIFHNLDDEHQRVLRAMALLDSESYIQAPDIERVLSFWGKLERHQHIETYTRHLCKSGLAVEAQLFAPHYAKSKLVPRAIVRRLPPLLEGALPDAANPGRLSETLCMGNPYALTDTVAQVTLLLEQSPMPLRPPMSRPQLEKFHKGLEGWDYVPEEILQLGQRLRTTYQPDMMLTIPPPHPILPDGAMKQLLPVAGNERRLEFILALLIASGILQPGSPVTPWPEVKTEFLKQDKLTQQATLTRVYFYMSNWSELWELLGQQLTLKRSWRFRHLGPHHLRARLVGMRHMALRTLASLPPDKWVTLQTLDRLMQLVWPHFDYTTQPTFYQSQTLQPWILFRDNSKTPLDPDDAQDWRLAQGNFIRALITGPLHWLGLADLNYSGDELTAVRLHGLSELYWDRSAIVSAPRRHSTPDVAERLADAVQIDQHQINVQPSAIDTQAHNLLDQIARLESATADCFSYHLDPQAAYEAFETNITLSEIEADWERLMPLPMPASIQSQLSQWWEAYGQVRIYENLTIIEFDDDYALAEMKAVTPLEKHLVAELSPRLVIIPDQTVDLLLGALEKAGYTPKKTEQV